MTRGSATLPESLAENSVTLPGRRKPLSRPRLDGLTDEALVAAACAARPGDDRAFEELVERHSGHVRANCRYLLGVESEAEDVAQEVFIRAYFALKDFERRAAFRTWIRRVKVNRCLTRLEERRRRIVDSIEDDEGPVPDALTRTPSVMAELERDDLRRRIDAVLMELSDALRVPLVLRDMDGMSYAEISAELGVSLSAVKMRIKRGRVAFRAAWDEAPATSRE